MGGVFVPRDRLQRLDTVTPLLAEDTFLDECWYDDDPDAEARDRAAQSMASTIAMATGLRPLPEVAQRVLAVVNDPNADLDELCGLIEGDPALASKLIRLANSAYMRRQNSCRSLRQAVQRLGFKMVRGLALSVATLDLFSDPWGESRRIREHSAGVGAIARVLTAAYDRRLVHEAFLAGLLHDLGKLLLHQSGELDFEALRVEHGHRRYELHVEERRRLGYDHAVLGGWILHQWSIPHPIPTVIGLHHRVEAAYDEDGPIGRLIGWLGVANELDKHVAEGAAADPTYFQWYARRPAFVRVGLTANMIQGQWGTLVAEREATLRVFQR